MRTGSIWEIIRDEIKTTVRYHLREMEKDAIKNPQKYTVGVRTVDLLMMLVDAVGNSNMEVHLEGININKQSCPVIQQCHI